MVPLLIAATLTLQNPAVPALLLVAQSRSLEILPGPLTCAVDAQREVVTLSVQPPKGVAVRWVAMDLPDSRSWAKPTKLESVAKNGVRTTFRHPHAAYAFVVTLSDDTQYRVTVSPTGHVRVLQTRRGTPAIPI